ncbi:hypothetical protein DFQ28_003962 [Apophysomyces sp. BC1034]|nr:hypothetical protein DFQ30_003685 [Apophysomyces sp. BC1015]KAG0178648.1 hypothetical protein DFQ29_003183 [Apophysomyces sp. BC1021]KAG0189062.1 hypothetical protein DFQ28_003962 [Apophysomyces sp. BC1034]
MATYINPEVRLAETAEDKQKCIDVRVRVFVDEQKYPLHTETEDPYDVDCIHWVAICEYRSMRIPVGTVRMYPVSPTVGKLGRLAVLQDARGLQLGVKLVQALIKEAHDRGKTAIVLHAQYDKQGFYEKLGFVVEKGDEETFLEDGTPHIRMWNRSI